MIGKPFHNLPIAPQPAMLPAAISAVVRRVVLNYGDVGCQSDSCVGAFNQIVAQQRIPRKSSIEDAEHRVDFVNPFTRERTFSVEVLIHVGDGSCIRIEPGFSGKYGGQPGASRALNAYVDPRLQNSVSR